MKLKKALKEKNKLVARISEDMQKVYSYNSVEEGTETPYDPIQSLDNVFKTVDELVDLKTRIHRANSKVYDKIFKLAELKSLAKQVRAIDCSAGKIVDRYDRQNIIQKKAAISILERDALVAKIEQEIEQIQEDLDLHNSKTSV
jgi:regulator of sigma D